jgi:hypothetical protein
VKIPTMQSEGADPAADVVARLEQAAARLRVERAAEVPPDSMRAALEGLDRARIQVRDARARLAELEAELRR